MTTAEVGGAVDTLPDLASAGGATVAGPEEAATAPPAPAPESSSAVVVIGVAVLTLAVVAGLLFLIGAPSAGAAGGCGGG